jgi:hypothetical protein
MNFVRWLKGSAWERVKCLFTTHDPIFVRNIYGDEIILRNWKRSEWRCLKCGAYFFHDSLSVDPRWFNRERPE